MTAASHQVMMHFFLLGGPRWLLAARSTNAPQGPCGVQWIWSLLCVSSLELPIVAHSACKNLLPHTFGVALYQAAFGVARCLQSQVPTSLAAPTYCIAHAFRKERIHASQPHVPVRHRPKPLLPLALAQHLSKPLLPLAVQHDWIPLASSLVKVP